MADSDVNVISHLLDVEKQASSLVTEARIDAEKRVSEARAKADAQFKSQFESISEKMETEYNSKIDELSKKHEKDFLEYTSVVDATEQDKEGFNELFKKVLEEL